jgi:D-3-phosphoglycerate dehydrogenase
MNDNVDILVTLSTFGAHSDEPIRLLEQSGFTFRTNPYGRRMKPSEVIELGCNCRALVSGVEPYTAETLAQLPNLRCISRCGVGIDSIDLAEAKRRGIAVLNTPDEPTAAVAELTLAMMLALLRQLPKVDSLMHQCKWQRVMGHLLAGKTVGIIGLGRIGRRVAELVQALGATVIGVEPYPDGDWVAARGVELMDLPALLARADIVSLHASTAPEHPLRLGVAELAQMKQGAWLVNMARGDMVDDEALCEALASGRLSGAGLDVLPQEPYCGPLCDNPCAILSPHQATLTLETRVAMEVRAVENVVRYLQTKV